MRRNCHPIAVLATTCWSVWRAAGEPIRPPVRPGPARAVGQAGGAGCPRSTRPPTCPRRRPQRRPRPGATARTRPATAGGQDARHVPKAGIDGGHFRPFGRLDRHEERKGPRDIKHDQHDRRERQKAHRDPGPGRRRPGRDEEKPREEECAADRIPDRDAVDEAQHHWRHEEKTVRERHRDTTDGFAQPASMQKIGI